MDLLFFDTETGGLTPGVSSLLQVGLVAYIDGKVNDELVISLKEDNYVVSAYSLQYNKLDLYNDIYCKGVSPQEAVKQIIDFINNNFTSPPVLVGHNPSIDKYMIKHLFERNNLNMDDFISHRMIDTMSLIWALHIKGKLPAETCSGSGAFNYFNIKSERLHDALSDCNSTVQLFEELMKLM